MRLRILSIVAALLAAPSLAAQSPPERTANDGNVVLSGVPEVPAEIAERFDAYQNVRFASFVDWMEDGRGIYVATRFGDVTQIHGVAMPGGARRQVTFFEEPVGGATRRPGGRELLFAMDEGGSEFDQLFLFDPADGRARRLTDGASRNTAASWSDDGRRVSFTSTRRDGRSNDVWVMEVGDTSSARVVKEAADGTFWGAADWSPDGERLLLLNYVGAADSRVHLLDLASGEATHLLGGGDAPASYAGITPAFDRTGRRIFVSTDADGEFERLVRYDLRRRRAEPVTADLPWNVESFAISPDRTRAAFTVNENGFSRLHLLDPETLRHRRVESLPEGLVGGLEFSPDGRRLGITLNSATTPSDAFSLALGDDPLSHGEVTRWTFSEVGGLDPDGFAVPELVRFRSFDRREIPAFVYRPSGPGPHPVIVTIHGGPESQYRPSFSSTVQSWVQELGAAVIAPNVRGSSGYGKTYLSLDNGMLRENSVRDIGALLDWIAEQPDLDADRVMVYGGSYGGYMVLASLVHFGDRLRGGVDIVGISDFVTFLENTQDYRRDLRRAEYGDERDPQMREFLAGIAPLRHADRIATPLFVIQGRNDPRVPVTEAEQIVREVRANGRDVWYMNALNEGHGYARKENQDLMRDLVVLFFREHLLGGGAAED